MQFTRVYLNAAGVVAYVFTSTDPILIDHITADDIVGSYDMEIEAGLPFGQIKSARELKNNMEMRGGEPAFKTDAPPDFAMSKVVRVR